MWDRTSDPDGVVEWEGEIDTSYKYTAGRAGKKFLQGLEDGEILAVACSECDKTWLPPRSYCQDCLSELDEWREVGPVGTVYTLTRTHPEGGDAEEAPTVTVGVIRFDGVEGGIIHRIEEDSRRLEIGDRVEAVFREKSQREGSTHDIIHFRPA